MQSRDPRVTFLQIPDLELKVQSEEVNLYPIGEAIYKSGSMAETFAQQVKLSVVEALRYSSTFASKWWKLSVKMHQKRSQRRLLTSQLNHTLAD